MNSATGQAARTRLRRFEYAVALAGFALLADAAGWELALAFLLITWSNNIRTRRYRL